MRQIAFFAAALTVFTGTLPAADQQMMKLLMPDAKIVAGINVEQAKTSQFGQYVLQHMGSDQDLQNFINLSGFDPRVDLQEILVGTSIGGEANSGLILARGKFDSARIAAMAIKTGGQQITTYKGVQILGGPGAKRKEAIAVIYNSVVIAGDLAGVQAAIDRVNAGSSIDAGLAARINELSTSQDAWSVSIAPVSALSKMPMPDPTIQGALQGDLLKTVQQTSGGIKFGPEIKITGEATATSDKDATALGDVVKFLAGMIQLNAKGEAVTTLVQKLVVSTEGSKVKVSLSMAEDQLEAFLKSANQNVPQKHKPAVI